MEEERLALQRRRLEIEVIEPARAAQQAAELDAKGAAAGLLESGRAEVEVLNWKNDVWQAAGDRGKELLLVQMLPAIVEQITAVAKDMKIDHMAIVDSGGGNAGPQAIVRQIGQLAPAVLESLKATTGIDVAAALQKGDQTEPDPATTAEEG